MTLFQVNVNDETLCYNQAFKLKRLLQITIARHESAHVIMDNYST